MSLYESDWCKSTARFYSLRIFGICRQFDVVHPQTWVLGFHWKICLESFLRVSFHLPTKLVSITKYSISFSSALPFSLIHFHDSALLEIIFLPFTLLSNPSPCYSSTSSSFLDLHLASIFTDYVSQNGTL